MARPGLTLTDPTSGQTITFVRTAAETDGELLELRSRYVGSRGRPPVHFHPAQDERFEVLEGELRVRVGREDRVLRTGDVLELPAGTRHAMHGTAEVRWEVRPALDTEGFFTEAFDPHASPLSRLAVAWRHRAEFRLAGPPGLLLAVLGPLLARRG